MIERPIVLGVVAGEPRSDSRMADHNPGGSAAAAGAPVAFHESVVMAGLQNLTSSSRLNGLRVLGRLILRRNSMSVLFRKN